MGKQNNYLPRCSGFGLIEVLVSILVLSIGLLGLAALQTASLRYKNEAQMRSQAVNQITAMSDRMRANRAGVTGGSYNSISGIPSKPNCKQCSPQQTAIKDTYEWNYENSYLFPAGQGTVTGDGSLFTITIMWDQDRTGATGTNCSGDTKKDLTCLSMSTQL